ncbi:hypothetical protein HDU76_001000 [Blyttiomyces sp. JEL0837]|nr:hypothetical protein HDU76_001000 [Blyttiomyces sp. JEL0837]
MNDNDQDQGADQPANTPFKITLNFPNPLTPQSRDPEMARASSDPPTSTTSAEQASSTSTESSHMQPLKIRFRMAQQNNDLMTPTTPGSNIPPTPTTRAEEASPRASLSLAPPTPSTPTTNANIDPPTPTPTPHILGTNYKIPPWNLPPKTKKLAYPPEAALKSVTEYRERVSVNVAIASMLAEREQQIELAKKNPYFGGDEYMDMDTGRRPPLPLSQRIQPMNKYVEDAFDYLASRKLNSNVNVDVGNNVRTHC